MQIKVILFFILTFFSSLLLAQSKNLSFLDQKTIKNNIVKEHYLGYKTFESDSTVHQHTALSTDSLLNNTVNNLHILENINEEGISINDYDKIITFNNEVYIVKVQNITLTEVRFIYPLNTRLETINRQNVSQIIYSDKRIDLFSAFDENNKDLLAINDERLIVDKKKVWEKIQASENSNDAAGMTEIGPVYAVYIADRIQISSNYLEKNGIIILKKRAANLKADYILITNKSVHRGYGDYPTIKVDGIAYKK